jgi:hypothetical protein
MSSTTDLKGGNIWSSIRAIWEYIHKLERRIIGGSGGTNQVIIGSFTNTSLIGGILRITIPHTTVFSLSMQDNTGADKMIEEIAKLDPSGTLITIDFNGYYPISGTWKYALTIYNQSISPSPSGSDPIRGSFTAFNLDVSGFLNIVLSEDISDFTISMTDNTGRKQFAEGVSRLATSKLIKIDMNGYFPIDDTWTYIIYTYQ